MKKIISSLTASLVLLCAASTASATMIDGTINFIGGAVLSTSGSTISKVTFDAGTVVNGSDALVTGDFDGLEGSSALFSDLNVADVTPYTLWTAGTFTFTITEIMTNTFTSGIFGTKNIGGYGYFTSTDSSFEQTAGEWIITANGASTNVSFSSTAIPAPAGAALLGLSLLGFGFARRNKKA